MRRILMTLAAVALLASVAPRPASAQAQTFRACYVPDVGALYLIGLEGLPTSCLSTAHVEISWTDGQAGVTDHGALTGLADDDHPEYVREGEPATGDLSGAYPAPNVARLQGHTVAATPPSAGHVLTWNGTLSAWEPQVASGVTDHGFLAGLGDDDHPEYVREGQVAAGDLSGSYPAPNVARLQGHTVAGITPTAGQVLTWNGTISMWEPQAATAGVTDHGALTGLADDDHPEYVREGETAAGDLVGTYPAPSVAGLQGNAVATTAPSDGQVLTWNGTSTAWEPQTAAAGVTDHGALTGLADDDHAQYLLANGVRTTTDGFAVTGTLGGGVIPAETTGPLFMWYSGKAAFRAGALYGSQWADVNIGDYSIALGQETTASGIAAMATGSGSIASGNYSTALGSSTEASGGASTALGSATTASGLQATALGSATVASANWSTAMGLSTTATGTAATALGRNTTAQSHASVVIGRYNVVAGDPTNWFVADPLFVAGNGSELTASNALTLLKNGNMTIAGTLTESSDRRLKVGVEPLGAVLQDLAAIRPVRFRFRPDTGHPADAQIGLIAQEVAAAFPELVSTDADGFLSLAYPKLTAVLLGAIQEQQAQIEARDEAIRALRQQAETQQAETRLITDRLERMEAILEQLQEGQR